ncbi:hypothetical protein DOTSEDRAFT_27797 [Dothistroma septosporum NZE10]|uniref:Uncharacterized protein n=1 Tax=Dothistroma septosporum (strain NZE10 / CBS 128990) TaxID=675120 RepID=N1PCR9_DOTSN|nr:hypothetical protein DOTSEDRAFT_27797 [Dothistroma septosporum NZE10]
MVISGVPVAATAQNHKPCRLLGLPAEIWSRIGRSAIDDVPNVTAEMIAQADNTENTIIRRQSTDSKSPAPCNQLLAYYYQTKAGFQTNESSDVLASSGEWLRCVGAVNRRHILGITVLMDWNEDPAELKDGMQDPYWKGIEFRLVKVRSPIVDGDGYAWDKYKVVFL